VTGLLKKIVSLVLDVSIRTLRGMPLQWALVFCRDLTLQSSEVPPITWALGKTRLACACQEPILLVRLRRLVTVCTLVYFSRPNPWDYVYSRKAVPVCLTTMYLSSLTSQPTTNQLNSLSTLYIYYLFKLFCLRMGCMYVFVNVFSHKCICRVYRNFEQHACVCPKVNIVSVAASNRHPVFIVCFPINIP